MLVFWKWHNAHHHRSAHVFGHHANTHTHIDAPNATRSSGNRSCCCDCRLLSFIAVWCVALLANKNTNNNKVVEEIPLWCRDNGNIRIQHRFALFTSWQQFMRVPLKIWCHLADSSSCRVIVWSCVLNLCSHIKIQFVSFYFWSN